MALGVGLEPTKVAPIPSTLIAKSLKRQTKNANPKNSHPKSRNPQKESNPKPKNQPKTQKTKLESRNFPPAKSRNKKISATGNQKTSKTQKSITEAKKTKIHPKLNRHFPRNRHFRRQTALGKLLVFSPFMCDTFYSVDEEIR